MSIRDILVHLDNSSASAARLDVAIAYASKHGAYLRGLYLITHMFYEPHTAGEKTDSEKAEQMFKEKTSAAGISTEWIFQDCSVMGSDMRSIITLHAYFTDLIILGQPDLSAPVMNIPTDLVEGIIVASGRPVLVVPYSGKFQTAGTRIMMAWKTGRESVRALNDALPHLEIANFVQIVEGSNTVESTGQSHDYLNSFLKKHNVTATYDIIHSGHLPIADMLLNNACENKIDLIVMGAFAPNGRGKLEVSPIARHVLKHLTAPVLMSH
ncbi:MAG: universal stress protein [Desulfuromonadaceae bacterium]|nr:universal stress protein [Desulfuromonadaceae bacterium]MDD5107777.1 universal stress protein [Desulfuromonadaceae bacterium]